MNYLSNHLQQFVTFVSILGAAFVALACELLRSNNEHLRRLNLELTVRREEESRRQQLLCAMLPAGVPAVALVDRPEMPSRNDEQKGMEVSVMPAISVAVEAPVDLIPAVEAIRKSREVTTLKPFAGPQLFVDDWIWGTQPDTDSLAPLNWNIVLTKGKGALSAEAADRPESKARLAELIPFEAIQSQSGELAPPEGFRDGSLAGRVLRSENPVRGLVVVIGLNGVAAHAGSGELTPEALVAGVTAHLRTMLEPGEFACQSDSDEFLLISPAVREGGAQRRLSVIAEKLWDYQLHTAGASTVLFSWGAVEGNGEPFKEVLATAAERMRETRRGRRSFSLDWPARRAV